MAVVTPNSKPALDGFAEISAPREGGRQASPPRGCGLCRARALPGRSMQVSVRSPPSSRSTLGFGEP